ncbi:NAD(P)H-binding protein [Kribbella sp. NPDC051952]|uniref:SDR family oxidoreductase n=1 Tax=Kribbella sp. NPDC051952 TaxID=3154851 RepID=UPI003414796A
MKILVTGATGTVGRHVVDGLHAAGIDVRALSRNPTSARLIGGDLSDPASVQSAAEGVDAVYLMWPFFSSDAAADVVKVLAGRRIVLLSSGAVDGRIPAAEPIARLHREVENAVVDATDEWTILRPGGFAANALDWAASIRTEGVVRGAAPDAAGAWVHESDLATVAIRALLEPHHVRRHYTLTGPEILTMAEQLEVIATVINRDLHWIHQSPAEAVAQFITAGWPPPYAETAVAIQQQLASVAPTITTTVADLTGVPARPFHQWVRDNRHAFT